MKVVIGGWDVCKFLDEVEVVCYCLFDGCDGFFVVVFKVVVVIVCMFLVDVIKVVVW